MKYETTHEVANLPDVAQMRHLAIDKLTAAHLSVDLLRRATDKEVDAIHELEIEDKVDDTINEALYEWYKYRKYKLRKYDELLHKFNLDQSTSIEEGNVLIKKHSKELDFLKQRRGIQ